LRWAALRYFNAAGTFGGLRERHDPETHLIPLTIAATKGGAPLRLFGEDWPTPDGTCIRDYVHVRDLAAAHLAALEHLAKGGESGVFNLGSGTGATVRQVIAEVERATGRQVPITPSPRREGDPAILVASIDKARRVLGWSPALGLAEIVASAI
jgi:UDP-glucose 4-epimerase